MIMSPEGTNIYLWGSSGETPVPLDLPVRVRSTSVQVVAREDLVEIGTANLADV
jgi:hypothetical protein